MVDKNPDYHESTRFIENTGDNLDEEASTVSSYRLESPHHHIIGVNTGELRMAVTYLLSELQGIDFPLNVSEEDFQKIKKVFADQGQVIDSLSIADNMKTIIPTFDQLSYIYEHYPELNVPTLHKRNLTDVYYNRKDKKWGLDKKNLLESERITAVKNELLAVFRERYLAAPDEAALNKPSILFRQSIIRHEFEHLQQYLDFFYGKADIQMDLFEIDSSLQKLIALDQTRSLAESEEYEAFYRAISQVSILGEVKAFLVEFTQEGKATVCEEAIQMRLAQFFHDLTVEAHDYFKEGSFEKMLRLVSENGHSRDDYSVALLLICIEDLSPISEWKKGENLDVSSLGKKVVDKMEQMVRNPQQFVDSISESFKAALDKAYLEKVLELKKAMQAFQELASLPEEQLKARKRYND